MFFQVSIDPKISTWSKEDRAPYRRALENLLTARREKKHYVHILPEDIENIRHLGRISDDGIEVLRWISGRFAEYEGLRASLSHVTIVRAGDAAMPSAAPGQVLIDVDLKIFADTSMIQPSILMCEDLKDCAFYKVMTEVWLSQRPDLRQLLLRLDHKGGGGTGIANEFATVVERGVAILAIADSDRLCKGAPLAEDSPAGLLLRVPVRSGLQLGICLECRNIENVISDELYSVALTDAARVKAYLASLYARLPDKEWRQHAHLKSGQKLYEFNALPANSSCRATWQPYVDELMPRGCPTPRKCTKKENCNCVLITSIGPAAHKQVDQWLKPYRARRELVDLFKHSLLYEEKVAITLAAWGCADGRSINSSV